MLTQKSKNKTLERLRKKLENKKILILGFGKEGQDSLKFLAEILPNINIGIADVNKDLDKKIANSSQKTLLNNITWHLGKNYLKAIGEYDVIFKSPGIPINLAEVKKAFLENKITSQTEIFLENYNGKIIGITGTKGKGTSSYFLYNLLRKANKKTMLAGNIGSPMLSKLLHIKKNEIVILEISSHQLFNLKISPKIAVFLNIFPAHLDYFKNFQQYYTAKSNVTLFQKKGPARLNNVSRSSGDNFIYSKDYPLLTKLARKTKAKKISFSQKDPSADFYIKENSILYKSKKYLSLPKGNSASLLKFVPGIIIAKNLGIKPSIIEKSIATHKGLPHRQEFVCKRKGISFYNDSLATVPEATILAIDSFGDRIDTLIIGGYDAHVNYSKLATKIKQTKIKNLIFFPPVGKKIYQKINQGNRHPRKYFFTDNMKSAINFAFTNTQEGKICLLSPSAPSFGIFKNYEERGNLFKQYAKGKKHSQIKK